MGSKMHINHLLNELPTTRARNVVREEAIRGRGVATVEEFVERLTVKKLLRTPNCGKLTAHQIARTLRSLGFPIKDDLPLMEEEWHKWCDYQGGEGKHTPMTGAYAEVWIAAWTACSRVRLSKLEKEQK